MTSEQRRRVRDLFEAALDLGDAAAPAWLERAAADDPVVLDELRSLWDHHHQAGAFLSRPVAEAVPSLLEDEAPLQVGTVLGPYEILGEIGRGGMGRVYLARDSRLGRKVALKALPPELVADPVHRARLKREARAAAALTHPGICTVYALEELDGAVYIAAEYVDGHSLREEIDRRERPASDAVVATARALAEALAAAHHQGIVHRDLKPDNVMRARDGSVKILDFGLARQTARDNGGRVSGTIVAGGLAGTLAYMAPEQLNGEPVDARADVFALGVLLYEYATGVHPFRAATPFATAGRILEGRAEGLEQLRPDLPAAMVTAVDRALEKSPATRFASAAEFLEALGERGGAAVREGASSAWWQTHQLIVIGLYFIASVAAWEIKQLLATAVPLSLFLAVGSAATIGGVFRGHLAFTAAVHPRLLSGERRRTGKLTLVVDLLISLAMIVDGLLLASASFVLYGLLAIALGIVIGLAAVWLEPATTTAAFGSES
jgi:predicted Ser/Thr protein kinase